MNVADSLITSGMTASSWFVQQNFLPYLLARRSGVRATGFEKLVFLKTLEILDHHLELEAYCNKESGGVCAALEKLIGTVKVPALRKKLIELRRNIHNDRLSDDSLYPEIELAIKEAFCPCEFQKINCWIESRRQRALLLQKADAVFASDLRNARSVLKHLVHNWEFRKGVALASPTLHHELQQYIQVSQPEHLKRLRRTESSLVRYYSRCAFKVSPFSSFMRTSLLRAQGDAKYSQQLKRGKTRIRRWVRLNRALIAHLAYLLSRHPELKDYGVVSANSSILHGDQNILFVRRQYREAIPVRMRVPYESVLKMPQSRGLTWVLNYIATCGGSISREELIIALSQPPNDIQHATSYVDKLVHISILTSSIVAGENLKGIEPLIKGLSVLPVARAARASHSLQRLSCFEKDFAHGRPSERPGLLQQARQAFKAAFAEAGADLSEDWNGPVVYEDSIEEPLTTVALPSEYQPICDDLKSFLSGYTGLLDSNVSLRETVRYLVQERYGGGPVPFLRFMHDSTDIFGEAVFQGWRQNHYTINPCNLENLQKLAALRKAFGLVVAKPSHENAVDLNALARDYQWTEQVERLGFARLMEDAFCMSCHCQPSVDDKYDANLVINLWSEGPFRTLLRSCNDFGDQHRKEVIAEIKDMFRRIWPNTEPCEIFAPADYNANLHCEVTDRQIRCEDGKISGSSDISLSDLALVIGSHQQLMIIEASSGKPILPLQLGMIGSVFTPVLQQFLLSVGNPDFVLHKNLFHPHHWSFENESRAAIEQFPRLVYGRCILRRKGWSVSHDALPQSCDSKNDVEHFLRVRRWQQDTGLPNEVFVFIEEPDAGPDRPKRLSRTAWNNRKPQYIDFRNYFLVQILEKVIKDTSGRLYFEEMLPNKESWKRWNLHRPTEFVLGLALHSRAVS